MCLMNLILHQIKQMLAPIAHENDLVLLLGAGKVNKLVNYLK